jgi:hypothetical protein
MDHHSGEAHIEDAAPAASVLLEADLRRVVLVELRTAEDFVEALQ